MMRSVLATTVALVMMTMSATAEDINACNGLSATYLPPGQGGQVVLIIAGSGPTDRDANNPLGVRAASYRLLAEGLAARGIGSLRYDKRGIGRSARAPEPEITMESSAADAECLARELAARPEVRHLTILGHSEGGLHAMRAGAALRRDVILLQTPGRRLIDSLAEQTLVSGMDPDLRDTLLRLTERIAAGEAVTDIPPEVSFLLRRSNLPFMRGALSIRPAREIANVRGRVLIIGGGTDLQVSRADFDDLSTARPDAETAWFPNMNHVLKVAPADPAANLATYADPNLPLADGLVDRIVAFIG
jgi:pimeloyl-ACP methyl ester carboxylesterase